MEDASRIQLEEKALKTHKITEKPILKPVILKKL